MTIVRSWPISSIIAALVMVAIIEWPVSPLSEPWFELGKRLIEAFFIGPILAVTLPKTGRLIALVVCILLAVALVVLASFVYSPTS